MQDVPYLMNISEDPILTGSLCYFFHDGGEGHGTHNQEALAAATTMRSHQRCSVVLDGIGVASFAALVLNTNGSLLIKPGWDAKPPKMNAARGNADDALEYAAEGEEGACRCLEMRW